MYSHIVSAIYQSDRVFFKYSAIVCINCASRVIRLNCKLHLGECFWYITLPKSVSKEAYYTILGGRGWGQRSLEYCESFH